MTVTEWLWVRYSLGGMNYYLLMFSFLRSGTKPESQAMSSVTQHAMPGKIRRKMGEQSVLTLCASAYPAICEMHLEAHFLILTVIFLNILYLNLCQPK